MIQATSGLPIAGEAAPAARMALTGLPVDAGPVTADRNGFSAVALEWRHEPDTAVAMPIVVPAHERSHPGAGHLSVGEWPAGVIRPVFHGAE